MIQINESSWAEYNYICIEPSVLILGMHVLFKRTPKIMDYHATFWMDLLCEHRSISIWIRLLHPQHLDGIRIGQDQYRMPLASLSEYQEP